MAKILFVVRDIEIVCKMLPKKDVDEEKEVPFSFSHCEKGDVA
jgi:hypothetical protein